MGGFKIASKTDWAGLPAKKTPGGSGETSATAEADEIDSVIKGDTVRSLYCRVPLIDLKAKHKVSNQQTIKQNIE